MRFFKMTVWIRRNSKLPSELYNVLNGIRYLSNKSAWITNIKRKLYLRQYPTLLVQPDGSATTIRHFEPRRIIKLPLDISTLSKEEQLIVLEKRKPKKKVIVEEDIDDNFDSNQYIRLLKRSAGEL